MLPGTRSRALLTVLRSAGLPFVALATAPLLLTTAQNTVVFDDVALATGTVHTSFGRSAGWSDLDQDGRLDLVTADAGQQNGYFRQRQDGTFEDATVAWGIDPVVEYEWGLLLADFDNDGDDDVYFANGGSPPASRAVRPYPNRMLRNDLATGGTLLDVGGGLGAAADADNTFGVTALDYDRDGMLDVFAADKGHTCRLFRNEGRLTFSDATPGSGLTRIGEWRHAGSGDFDLDGWPDVGVGNGSASNALYRNEADGSFVDVAVGAGVSVASDTFGMVFQDYDNDGILDVYVALYQRNPTTQSPVFLGRGDGTFFNASMGTGMGAHTDMGHDSGDVDGDGFPDIMMGTGNQSFVDFDVLYRVRPAQAGRLSITDVSAASRFSSSGQSRQHGQALGDYDRDGDIDVYCNNGGPESDAITAQGNFFWNNRGNSFAWTALEVEGVLSNRTGVGLWATATTAEGNDVQRTLQVGRGFSNTPDHALHFGLGTDTAVERVVLRWPSGIVQPVDEPALRTYTPVIETGMLRVGTPTIGQSFSFEFAGAPGDLVELGFSLGTATLPLDGVHGDQLLAAPLTLLPAIPLDGSGRRTLPVPIPNLPSLVGLTVHSQAWIHGIAGLGTMSQLQSFTIQ